MVDQFVKDGHGPKAKVTVAWLRKLWRWAFEREIVAAPIMDAVKVRYQKRSRDRVYSDEDIKTIWRAAEQLPAARIRVRQAGAVAGSAQDGACRHAVGGHRPQGRSRIWKTPHEFTKVRKTSDPSRCYLTPLPPLVQRILKGLPQSEARVFPSLVVYETPAERPWFDSSRLTKRLVRAGAPKDFAFHACRHTLATWLQNKGHSEWERGLGAQPFRDGIGHRGLFSRLSSRIEADSVGEMGGSCRATGAARRRHGAAMIKILHGLALAVMFGSTAALFLSN